MKNHNIAKIQDFAIKIKKIKLIAYQISQNFQKIMIHFDKNKFLDAMREKFNHHIKKNT